MALFLVRMTVELPADLDPGQRKELLDSESEYSQRLQRSGRWRHLWRVAGRFGNVSVFDAADNDELHAMLWDLPLFPYLSLEITPLSAHPSRIPFDEIAFND
ncbi:muconolactone Delta-isomerase family protein [Pseudonocardia sp. GCM10023141]|uniref:muconolactone Delta-isomerase family protein n=1 Tax=Pseudonocardia sp. GCM10023141 TaxID=3252653 RepID=UPI00360A6A11